MIVQSNYQPQLPFKSKHFNTIYRTLFHHIKPSFDRERIETVDGDFIDLDWSTIGSKKLCVLIHGLEGSSNSTYMLTQTQIFNENDLLDNESMTTYVPTDFNTELTSTDDDKLSDRTIEDFDTLITDVNEDDDNCLFLFLFF